MKGWIILGGLCAFFALTAWTYPPSTRLPEWIARSERNPAPRLNFRYLLLPEQTYEDLWEDVKDYLEDRLPKSALEVVEQIYAKAQAEGNQPQRIKALIVRTSLHAETTDEEDLVRYTELREEMESSRGVPRAVLNSVLGEFLWNYYQSHRLQVMSRTATVGSAPEDYRTWEPRRYFDTTRAYYEASISPKSELQSTPIRRYKDILFTVEGSERFRPTLFDLLAHRALDFFRNDETSLPTSIRELEIEETWGYIPSQEFVGTSITTPDSSSLRLATIKLLQELTAFHLNDSDAAPLVDIELNRLAYIRSIARFQDADSLYALAVDRLAKCYSGNAAASSIHYQSALYYKEKDELSRAMRICDEVIRIYPSTSSGTADCLSLKKEMLMRSLSVSTEQTIQPHKPFLFNIKWRNVEKVFVRIVRLPATLMDQAINYRRIYLSEEEIKLVLRVDNVHEFSIALPNNTPADFKEAVSAFKAPELDYGHYVILVSPNNEFKLTDNVIAYTLVTATNMTVITQSLGNGLALIRVSNAVTGAPIEGVRVTLTGIRYKSKEPHDDRIVILDTLSNSQGIVVARCKAIEFRRVEVECNNLDDRLVVADAIAREYPQTDYSRRQQLLFTDRSIYRPGQTVYYKGICYNQSVMKGTAEVISGLAGEITLRDANRQQVAAANYKTNKFGSFNGSFQLPVSALPGTMILESDDGWISIRVEEYKRPRFEVSFKPVVGTIQLEDTVRVIGIATAFAGSAVDGAQISYRVERDGTWQRSEYWAYRSQNNATDILHGTATSDGTGTFKISFKAEPDRAYPRRLLPRFSYTIIADVTDINGETRTAMTRVWAGYTSTQLSFAQREPIETGYEGAIAIRASNLNGQPLSLHGRFLIDHLAPPARLNRHRWLSRPTNFSMTIDEFTNAFPLDAYDVDSSSPATWRSDRTVLERRFNTDSLGVDSVALMRLKPGYYRMIAENVTPTGDTVRASEPMTIFDRSAPLPLSPEPLTQLNIRTSGEPGDTAQILVGSGFSDGSLLYEVMDGGEIVSSEVISLANRQQLLSLPIVEEFRGGVTIYLVLTHDHRTYTRSIPIDVPWSNRMLKIVTSTFRDKLNPGQSEEWKLTISGLKGDSVAAEFVATLYDASLDAIQPHSWKRATWENSWSNGNFINRTSGISIGSEWDIGWNDYYRMRFNRGYDRLNATRLLYRVRRNYYGDYGNPLDPRGTAIMSSGFGAEYGDVLSGIVKNDPPDDLMVFASTVENLQQQRSRSGSPTQYKDDTRTSETPGLQIRSNLNETAFFIPDLQTNDKGEVVLKFTMPEALTRWRLMGFAHTMEMKVGTIERTVVTQKELMVIPNLPRFFREGDSITFPIKISNLAARVASGKVHLEILDAVTMQRRDSAYGLYRGEQPFTLPAGRSTNVEWKLRVPDGPGVALYRVTATAGNFSDGEEGPIPVLPNRMLVTETLPLNIRGNESRNYTMPKLIASATSSSTLRNQNLTLEMTSNPAWYAVQALPYLMEYPYDCAEQTFSRLYANAIASHIANSNPKIKRVFESWKGTDALVSNLEKNQELKGLLLQETPWVMQGANETERKQRIALLFNLNRMSGEFERTMRDLNNLQNSNGGWPWFEGMRPDAFVSQHIVAGFGHLGVLGVKAGEEKTISMMVRRALGFIDQEMTKRYRDLESGRNFDEDADNINDIELHYLYARSFFVDEPIASANKEAFSYWMEQAERYWMHKGLMSQGMIALALKRFGDQSIPMKIIASLRERSLHSDELGTYWKFEEGWWWYQAPVETQAILIEAFDVVIGDQKEIDEMKIWLLKQKQVQDWKTTKATAEACYALLRRGSDFLASDKLVEVTIGGQRVDPTSGGTATAEAGTGYFKTSWSASEITPSMGNITVTKRDAGIAWGALYWQYFEQLDKITPHTSPLSISKGMFLQKNTDRGKVLEALGSGVELHVGDVVVVRVEVRSDRDMEYIHVKDMRGAGLEPMQQLSGYRWQGGLGYYQAIKDASTDFFIGWLPKGVWVFEYPLRVSHKGRFSNGISTVQSMYAPEFAGHSAGEIVAVR
jgi:hypothetical protein